MSHLFLTASDSRAGAQVGWNILECLKCPCVDAHPDLVFFITSFRPFPVCLTQSADDLLIAYLKLLPLFERVVRAEPLFVEDRVLCSSG